MVSQFNLSYTSVLNTCTHQQHNNTKGNLFHLKLKNYWKISLDKLNKHWHNLLICHLHWRHNYFSDNHADDARMCKIVVLTQYTKFDAFMSFANHSNLWWRDLHSRMSFEGMAPRWFQEWVQSGRGSHYPLPHLPNPNNFYPGDAYKMSNP